MKPGAVLRLREALGTRDHDVLIALQRFRLLTSPQIQRLLFTDHSSSLAAARACNRAMYRLRDLGLVTALDRRIGGVRRGSASFVWQLAATGEHYLRSLTGHGHRRRFVEPGRQFVEHTLAVNDVAVGLLEAVAERPELSVDLLETEPSNWLRYLGAAGQAQWLKPDLHLIATTREGNDDFEDHAFLEIDLGTEHIPRIQAKCRVYTAFAATGVYQARHGLFPAVVWLSPNPVRRAALRAAVAATSGLPSGTFRVIDPEEYVRSWRDQ